MLIRTPVLEENHFTSLIFLHFKPYNGAHDSANTCTTGTLCEIVSYCFKDMAINYNKSVMNRCNTWRQGTPIHVCV